MSTSSQPDQPVHVDDVAALKDIAIIETTSKDVADHQSEREALLGD